MAKGRRTSSSHQLSALSCAPDEVPHLHGGELPQVSICKCALKLGRKLQVPVYQFLRAPLVRAFGEEFYTQLEEVAALLKAEREEAEASQS